MNNIMEEKDQDTAKVVRHNRLGKFWKPLASAAIAAVAAVSMGMSAGAANAAATDITGYHHVDYVSVNYTGSAIKLGSNLEDTNWVPAGSYNIDVPSTTGASGTGYIIPQTKDEAVARNVPWVGFFGDESLWGITGASASSQLTLNLTGATYKPKTGSGTATVTASQDGKTWFSASGFAAAPPATSNLPVTAGSHTFTFNGESDDEVFHEHTQWVFSKAGTYNLTFSAKTTIGGVTYTAPAQQYTFKVGV
jgi:surface-anchored protein